MKLIYLKSALKCSSFDVSIGIKIPFLRVSVTIEPGRSLLQFVTTSFLKSHKAQGLTYLLELKACSSRIEDHPGTQQKKTSFLSHISISSGWLHDINPVTVPASALLAEATNWLQVGFDSGKPGFLLSSYSLLPRRKW